MMLWHTSTSITHAEILLVVRIFFLEVIQAGRHAWALTSTVQQPIRTTSVQHFAQGCCHLHSLAGLLPPFLVLRRSEFGVGETFVTARSALRCAVCESSSVMARGAARRSDPQISLWWLDLEAGVCTSARRLCGGTIDGAPVIAVSALDSRPG